MIVGNCCKRRVALIRIVAAVFQLTLVHTVATVRSNNSFGS
jgi:hypothetical protein